LALALLAGAVPAAQDDSLALQSCLVLHGYALAGLNNGAGGVRTVMAVLDTAKLWLVVDPRASTSFLDIARIRKLGYSAKPTTIDINVSGRREPVYSVALADLKLGTFSSGPITFYLTRVDYIAAAAGIEDSRTIDGIIGSDLLTRFSAVMDLKRNALYLKNPPPKAAPADSASKAAPADTLTPESDRGSLLRKVEKRLKRQPSP
jgi:hypothetical protein